MKHFDPQLSGSTVASGSMSIDNHVLPAQDNVYDLGSDSFNWRNLYGTASHAITASYALNASSGGGSTPAGTISGSQQILDFGFISGSLVAGDNIIINQVGGDFEISSSAAGGSTPSGTISGSQQIEDFGFLLPASTGSFYVSSSVSGDTITFTQGDDTTETVTIETVNTASGIINPNTNSFIQVWVGNLTEYNAISPKDPNILYFVV